MSHAPPAVRLPLRAGVGASTVALQRGAWPTVLDFLAERLPVIDRAEWQARMAAGGVLDELGQPLPPHAPYRWPTRVHYYRERPAGMPPEAVIPFDATVLYQDEHLLVADKPHFLPVVPSGRHVHETLLVRLKRQTGLADLVPIHRIDQDTAGLVLFSANAATRAAWFGQFRERAVRKTYLAVGPAKAGVAVGHVQTLRSHLLPSGHRMQMQERQLSDASPVNATTALTCLGLREDALHGRLALYRLEPHTGKRHQLRVQMAGWGSALLHDRLYPRLEPELPPGQLPDLSRPLQLLAKRLELVHAVTQKPLRFDSERLLAAWPTTPI